MVTAVDVNAVARVVGIKTAFVNLRPAGSALLPQRVAVIGQGATAATYATTKQQVTSAVQAGNLYGFGSPVHLAVQQLLPQNGDGVGTIPVTVYPLEDDGSGVAATGDITPTASQTEAASYVVKINGIESDAFVIAVGDNVAAITAAITTAINANLSMPVIAVDNGTDVGLTSKWAGTSANDIFVEIDTDTTAGATFVITQLSGGLVNPSVQPALDQFGDVWETMVLNCLEIADTTNLDLYQTHGLGRWGALVRKPYVCFTGTPEEDVATAITIPEARKATDFVNGQLETPGSVNLPLVIAARQLARIVTVANENPARDYGSQEATGLIPGTDGEQWDYAQRQQAVLGGSSTVTVKDGVVNIGDVITFYHPTGDPTPAYRFVKDIVKLQNIIFNLDLAFVNPEWDGAPLIPDNQPTTNRSAKKPKDARALVATIVDNLALEAILSDPETAKQTITAEINGTNPNRLDVSVTVQLSGNSNIISVDLNFGFYFGS